MKETAPVAIHVPFRRSTLGSSFAGCYDGFSSSMIVPYGLIYNHLTSLRDVFNAICEKNMRLSQRDVIPESGKLTFSVTTSAKGGTDIKIGSDTIHVRKYTRAHHPLVQMLLFAELYWGKFQIAKSMVPQTIIDMFKKSSSSTSPKMYEAGWSPAKCRSNLLKAATPEDSRVESNGRSNEASLLPVLKQHNDMLSSDSHTIPSAVEMGSMTSEARCDLTVCAPEEYLHLYQHFNNNPAICPTHTDVQRQIRETEPENQLRRMTDSTIVGKASLGEDGLFQLDYLKVPLGT